MKIHANARTCPNSRRLLVKRIEEEDWCLHGFRPTAFRRSRPYDVCG